MTHIYTLLTFVVQEIMTSATKVSLGSSSPADRNKIFLIVSVLRGILLSMKKITETEIVSLQIPFSEYTGLCALLNVYEESTRLLLGANDPLTSSMSKLVDEIIILAGEYTIKSENASSSDESVGVIKEAASEFLQKKNF